MLENKRERLKTFLRKIDEKAIVRIKHFMKESSYPVDCGGGAPAKVKRASKSGIRSGSFKRKIDSMRQPSMEEAQPELQQQPQQQQQHKTLARQPPVRPQTFDLDSRAFERTDGTGSQSSFIKHNNTFHKLFPDIPEGENLIHAYVCALQKEVPYHGRLYITDSHACFYSSVLLKDTKVVISVSSIQKVKKQNMALLVPNAISIRTGEGDKYLFVSLRNREACYRLLRAISPQLEEGSTNSSLVFSSAENSDKSKLVNSSQSSLDDSFDQHDRSLPQTPVEPPPQIPQKEPVSNGKATTLKTLHTQESNSRYSEQPLGEAGSWLGSVKERARTLLSQREASTLNTLLMVYMILVLLLLLSSGYIGLRIVALEEQLTSLGALPEFSLQSGYQDT